MEWKNQKNKTVVVLTGTTTAEATTIIRTRGIIKGAKEGRSYFHQDFKFDKDNTKFQIQNSKSIFIVLFKKLRYY